ncbi:SDR family NAD(P)-dependent oxidoreductase [Streptomyces gobitricini]|uniref:Enediyne polyketide synthase n=1 Tax=Streptomyces gobitricini TaxID=68211 RepID=A0ABP6A1R0_9ACTN
MSDTHDDRAVAIVGMACRYPDADRPDRLWEMVLEQRRAFRRLPEERMAADDYYDPDPTAADRTYSLYAAVLEGWSFDRSAFRIPGPVFRAGDPAHWLALETAARALEDAGFPGGTGLARDRVGVVLGNSLTGDATRAGTLRLRWPYVRRVLAAALEAAHVTADVRDDVVRRARAGYLAPFPPTTEESLAGALSNTIAGRVCNHFDFHGGGYTVDGACASSLLAVVELCRALTDHSVDFGLAGGVDLSLDPFELVGFAKTGALAGDRMRVYDERSAGFWPGEGCGMLALMRAADARAAGLRVYAEIHGWGVSSDGSGGITRPGRDGQLLALRRAYDLAGADPAEVLLHEGHGTGTRVGDEVELSALTALREGARARAALGTVKANIGHTKAAAGAAGVIKAAMSVHTGVLPPTTGCETPHPLLRSPGSPLRVLRGAEHWPEGRRLAGVSSMGFGGINAHLVLSAPPAGTTTPVRASLPVRRPAPEHAVVAAAGADTEEVRAFFARVAQAAPRLSFAELHDLAARSASEAATGPVRAAVVAATPAELAARAASAATRLAAGAAPGDLTHLPGVWVGQGVRGRVTLLFPGQGAPGLAGAASTETAQPAIHRASLGGLRALDALGVTATAAVGHSLGEITALVWAGALSVRDSFRLVRARGRLMAALGASGTGMLGLRTDPSTALALCEGTELVVAAFNGPRSVVVAGPSAHLREAADRAGRAGIARTPLPVSHGFHSPAVRSCVPPLSRVVAALDLGRPSRRLMSTVHGRALTPDDDLAALLADQVTAPVRFWDAISGVLPDTDLFCACGPGQGLAALVADQGGGVPVVTVGSGDPDAADTAHAAAALFAAGACARLDALTVGRAVRPIDIGRPRTFLASPCSAPPPFGEPRPEEPAATGAAPPAPSAVPGPRPSATAPAALAVQAVTAPTARTALAVQAATAGTAPTTGTPGAAHTAGTTGTPGAAHTTGTAATAATADTASAVRELLARATELEPELIGMETRLLTDLHLTSLTVTQLAASAAHRMGRRSPAAPLSLADARVGDLVAALEALPSAGAPAPETVATGVDTWVHCFTEQLLPAPDGPPSPSTGRRTTVLGDGGLAVRAEELYGSAPGADTELVYVPNTPGPVPVARLLTAARSALRTGRLVVVAHDTALAGFLGSLHKEHPRLGVTLLRVPPTEAGLRHATRWAGAEPGRYQELVLDDHGTAHVPAAHVLRLPEPGPGHPLPLGPDDVLLVSGGGKGIGHSCALALARRTGVRLALVGRARPGDDATLRANLAALDAAGVSAAYEPADLGDRAAVADAVRRLTDRLGRPVTGVLHAAGVNEPARFTDLDEARVEAHLAPKAAGLRHLLAAVPTGRLRLLVGFGSVIGRYGLPGESHYALANGLLRTELERLAEELPPHCRVLNVDWSVWSGAGMGVRLGVLDALVREDITPIAPDTGTDLFLRLLAAGSGTGPTVAVHGRLGRDVPVPAVPGPPQRFLEELRVHQPAVELVAEARLALRTDPYLAGHRLDGVVWLPGVLGLEAMAQAASAVAGRPLSEARDIAWTRPVTVPEEGPRTVRVCALHRGDRVETVLRSDEDDFCVDHFRAVFPLSAPFPDGHRPSPGNTGDEVPAHELYGPLYFHTGPFRRVRSLTAPTARTCLADLGAASPTPWFPDPFAAPLLGDPSANDATLHALQACVPHRRLLPVAADAVSVRRGAGPVERVRGGERAAADGEYTWDVDGLDATGRPAVRWRGLRLKDVGPLPRGERPWPAPLLAVLLERAATALGLGEGLRVTVGPGERRTPPDRPRPGLSRSHLDGLVLQVESGARTQVACDWEAVTARTEADWRAMLGTEHQALAELLGRRGGEPFAVAATRVWTAAECLSKAGRPPRAPLALYGVFDGGWVVLRSGDALIVSGVVRVAAHGGERVAVAVLGTPEESR